MNTVPDWTAGELVFGSGNTEVYEQEDEFVLTFEILGFNRDDIDFVWDYEGRRIKVEAERVDEDRGRRRTYHRTFRASKDVDLDGIGATYRNGVLEVTLPLAETNESGRIIEIQEA